MNFYLVGIKGSGMSTLASILFDLGNNVLGYDDSDTYKYTMKGLEERGIKVYSKGNYPELAEDTIVTYTAAIDLSHHEVARVKKLGYKIIPYHELIGYLTKKFESICVCGTHGKTTTSLLLAKILDKTLGCNYFVGDGTGHANKTNNLFVVESCEYNKHFLAYFPDKVVITNIDLDHTETYKNIDIMIETYQEFINKCKGFVVACGDDENILKLSIKNSYYYGFNNNNDLIIKNKYVFENKTHFDVYYRGKFYNHFDVSMFGDHLLKDVLAVIMISILYNVPKEIVSDIVINYHPAARRFNETIIKDIVVVDDYAHHPTEIKATYDSAHQKYPDKEVVAVFLPNTYSRTKDLFNEFVSSLNIYDKVYLMEIKSDRENKDDFKDISSEKLSEQINNCEMINLDSCDKLLKHKNSVICFMSCANITPMITKFKKIINK